MLSEYQIFVSSYIIRMEDEWVLLIGVTVTWAA